MPRATKQNAALIPIRCSTTRHRRARDCFGQRDADGGDISARTAECGVPQRLPRNDARRTQPHQMCDDAAGFVGTPPGPSCAMHGDLEGAIIALCTLTSPILRLVPSDLRCSMDQKASAARASRRLHTTTRRLGTTRQPASNPTKFTRCEKLWIDSDAHRVLEDKTTCCVPPQPICGATCSAPHSPTAQCRELQNKLPHSTHSHQVQHSPPPARTRLFRTAGCRWRRH